MSDSIPGFAGQSSGDRRTAFPAALSRIHATEVPAKHAKDAKAAGLTPALKLGAIVTKG
jgi:hypothetical protein